MSSSTVTVRVRRIEPEHRRTRAKVRRYSQPKGAVAFSPLSRAQANARIHALRRWEHAQKRAPGKKNRAVGYVGLEVHRFLVNRACSAGGRLDDLSLTRIAQILKFARSAVIAALARLRAFGWLDWKRTWIPSSRPTARGPSMEQAENAYWLTAPLKALVKLGLKLWADGDGFEAAGADRKGVWADQAFAETRLGAALARLATALGIRETS